MKTEMQLSTKIMRWVAYGVLGLVILAGIGSVLSGSNGSSSSSSSVDTYDEPMF